MTATPQQLMARFSAEMQALDPARPSGSVQPLELLLDDDLPVRITLHPGLRHWLIEAFVHDAVALYGPLRHSLVHTLLQINEATVHGRHMICTLDHSDLVVLITRWPVPPVEPDGFVAWLEYTVEQARRLREAVRAMVSVQDEAFHPPGALS